MRTSLHIDGDELLGRYDRGMEQWIPLLVAAVGACAAIGVAFWNSRGDFSELRQLKSMNEALTTMPDGEHRKIFATARDDLAVRVAARVASAPRRRRLTWWSVLGVSGLGMVVALLVLLSPFISEKAAEIASTFAGILAAVVTAGALAATAQRLNQRQAELEAERSTARLRAMERWLRNQRTDGAE